MWQGDRTWFAIRLALRVRAVDGAASAFTLLSAAGATVLAAISHNANTATSGRRAPATALGAAVAVVVCAQARCCGVSTLRADGFAVAIHIPTVWLSAISSQGHHTLRST